MKIIDSSALIATLIDIITEFLLDTTSVYIDLEGENFLVTGYP